MTRRKSQKESSPPPGRSRLALFYFVTLLIVLLLLAAVEVTLRLCTSAPEVGLYDPYVSFSGLRPLFALDSTTERFETAAERLGAFRRQSFAAKKAPGTFRAFCLGGSTVQGRPYSVETSFTTWLKLNLSAAEPKIDYEIINCGGISYASYRLVPVMRELLEYEPDLFIICTGHNEFLEDRTYNRIKKTPRSLLRLHRSLLSLRSYALADRFISRRRAKGSQSQSKTALPPEVQTKLDLERGLESYHRDRTWHQGTIEHFARNLETMVRMSRGQDVPVILINPASNLKDCPPFKAEPTAGLAESQTEEVAALRQQAAELDWSDTYGKISLIEKAASIDDRNAGLLFLLGSYYHRLGRFQEAKKWFGRAKEEDVCPLRMLESMHQTVLETASIYDTGLIDARALIEERTEGGIPGKEWLVDHVHPSVEGHQLIADELFTTMADMRLVQKADDWQARRDKLRQEHLSSLDEAYYARGAERLKRLQQWSRGRIPRE
ncbi:MAG: GDSL-type esterase/lipase family protein [Planctomycetota bacterium]|jgi:lysophospholipase L1-like esterase